MASTSRVPAPLASPDSQDDGFVFVDFDDETDVRSDVATVSDNSSAALSEVSSSASAARFTPGEARGADSDAGQAPTPAPSIETIEEALARAAASEQQLAEAEARHSAAQAKLESLNAKTASVKTKLAQTEATCADCTTQLRARQAQASQLGQELEAASTAVSDRKRQIQAAQRERRALEASVEQLLQSSTSLKSRQSALQAEIHETQASVHTLEERARALKREAVAATQACAHAKDQVDLVKAKHRATEAAVAKLRSNEAEARKTLEQLGRRVQALRLSIEDRTKAAVGLESELRSLQKQSAGASQADEPSAKRHHSQMIDAHTSPLAHSALLSAEGLPFGGQAQPHAQARGGRSSRRGSRGAGHATSATTAGERTQAQQAMFELLRTINALGKSGDVPLETCSLLKGLVLDVTCRQR